MPLSQTGEDRSRSVSSTRTMKRPPKCRAKSQFSSAVRAAPRWRDPVGLGAKRTRGSRSSGKSIFRSPLLAIILGNCRLPEHNNRHGRGSLTPPHETQAVGGGGFYADLGRVQTKRLGELFSHQRYEIREARRLQANCGIYIGCRVTRPQDVQGASEQLQAGNTGVPGIAGGEMTADVSQGGCSEQSVYHGMGENIGIGVSLKPLSERHLDTPQDQRSP